jgi:putative redox protein
MAHVVVASTQDLQQEIQAGKHRFYSDEHFEAGGNDTGPDPYGLLLSALGA